MRQDAEGPYNDAMQRLSRSDPFREIKAAELNNRRNESLEAAKAFDKKTKRQKRRKQRFIVKNGKFNAKQQNKKFNRI